MNSGFIAGVLAVALSVASAFPGAAQAQSGELPECNGNNVWTTHVLLVPEPFGVTFETYLCTPEGWVLVGSSYCSNDGNCSSD